MKGQAQAVTSVAAVIFATVFVIVGLITYGVVSNVTPHDRTIINETLCATGACLVGTSYEFDFNPILNDSALVCHNTTTGTIMTNGDILGITLGYNTIATTYINLTNSTAGHYGNVVCTYTYDEANANEQGFYDSNTSNTFAGFTLAAIIAIVLAGVAIVGIVTLIRG